jgi:hypothetical protein
MVPRPRALKILFSNLLFGCSGVLGNEPANRLTPFQYWGLCEANHRGALNLGAVYLLSLGDRYPLLDAQVTVRKLTWAIEMEVADDGKGFRVDCVLGARRNNRPGVLGMRESVEMVGGQFHLESVPGQGATVRARIPAGRGRGLRGNSHSSTV